MRKGFYKLCQATHSGDANDPFVDRAHRADDIGRCAACDWPAALAP